MLWPPVQGAHVCRAGWALEEGEQLVDGRTQHDSKTAHSTSLSQTLFCPTGPAVSTIRMSGAHAREGRRLSWQAERVDQQRSDGGWGDIRIENGILSARIDKGSMFTRLLIKHAQCSCFFNADSVSCDSLQDNLIWKDSSRGTQRPFSKCYFSHKEYLMQIDGYKHTYLGRIIMAWKLNE